MTERLEKRLAHLRASDAYIAYERARTAVLAMKNIQIPDGRTAAEPSAYWSEELANLDYMLDASPLVIDRLRHHCYHITGVWPYNYRSLKERNKLQHEIKLDALLEKGRSELFVPEPEALGGFGFRSPQGLYNVDTLKYFEVLIALDQAAILQPFLDGGDRRIVWEIGSGWGGFAYQFKTLAPATTYVMVDLPELFLYSGTYLLGMFPDAKAWFYGIDGTKPDDVPWGEADFVFIPNTGLEALRPPRLDLTLNMVSFQEMTTAQVDEYVRHAAACHSPFLYSLNRERSHYNPELIGVQELVESAYWPHEIDVLPVSYATFPSTPEALRRSGKKQRGDAGMDYRHLVGWRRISP